MAKLRETTHALCKVSFHAQPDTFVLLEAHSAPANLRMAYHFLTTPDDDQERL